MVEVKKRRGMLRCEKGSQLVEFALVLPLLLLIVLAIADFGFMFQRYEVLTNAAREGARVAVLPGYDEDDVRLRVNAYLDAGRVPDDGGRSPAVVEDDVVDIPGGTSITTKRVTVRYTYTYMFMPGIAGWFDKSYVTEQLSAVSEMRVEVVVTGS